MTVEKVALPTALCYTSDEGEGYYRQPRGEKVVICDADGKLCKDEEVLERVENMVIPPQWSDVWICKLPNGHLQCTGRDAKGRKQYIYHDAYTAYRQRAKFDKLVEFAEKLPLLREEVARQLRRRTWDEERMLALVIRLLDKTHLRIGSRRYEEQNHTYGLTTLRRRHVDESDELKLCFNAKSGKFRRVTIKNRQLKRLVHEVSELPGYRLFSYKDDDGRTQSLDSAHVNDYIHEHMGDRFSAKDFRTWAGTSLGVKYYPEVLAEFQEKKRGKLETQLVRRVAKDLGNTLSVCRQYYIHPEVLAKAANQELPNTPWKHNDPKPGKLLPYEQYTLDLIKAAQLEPEP